MTPAPTILRLPIADVAIGEHIGLVSDPHVAHLAARFEIDGQTTPVGVRRNGARAAKPWTLALGRHRFLAAGALGWTHIDALQVADEHDGPDAIERLQLADSLDHRVLRPIDRSLFIAARWAVEMDRQEPGSQHSSGRRRSALTRWDALATMANASEADDLTAKACGCSPRSVRRYRQIIVGIVQRFPDLYADLNAHPAADKLSGILSIAEHKGTADVRKAIGFLLADPNLAIKQAMVMAGCAEDNGFREPTEEKRRAASMSRMWDAMTIVEQKSHALMIARRGKASVRKELAEELKRQGFMS